MAKILRVGDEVVVKQFSFTNGSGGTGMSNWKYDPIFWGESVVKITKTWNDSETGRRFIGEARSRDLKAYLLQNANAADQRVFFSEWDI